LDVIFGFYSDLMASSATFHTIYHQHWLPMNRGDRLEIRFYDHFEEDFDAGGRARGLTPAIHPDSAFFYKQGQ
jgi:hypothetical protein